MKMFLYHYYEKNLGPFMSLTALPFETAREVLYAKKAAGTFGNPDVAVFLHNRYSQERRLREAFISKGGKPKRAFPIYMTLSEHRQWESAYEEAAVIKIPLQEFARESVSFTYGDSFAIFNSSLFGEEEYWNKVYFADEIVEMVTRLGFPPYVDYDFKRAVYPTDKHINHHLKYVEAHVWDDTVLDTYLPYGSKKRKGNKG